MQGDKSSTNKLAMSRALGAAFLSHQVEQLERTVGKEVRSTTNNNWRDRESGQSAGGRGARRGGAPHTHRGGKKGRKEGGRDGGEVVKPSEPKQPVTSDNRDAEVIVVDASVLIHALGHIKKWCRDGREEIVLIPLEALNTLDLLKKGATPLAQRARAASRILESQVGTNPRIRVQRDDAFIPWDDISFTIPEEFPALGAVPHDGPPSLPTGLAPPPEWLRRTICCAKWEVDNAADPSRSDEAAAFPPLPKPVLSRPSTPLSSVTPSSYSSVKSISHNEMKRVISKGNPKKSKVVLALVVMPTSGATSSLDPSALHSTKYERADGSLVRMWARQCGIDTFDVEPTPAASVTHPPSPGHSPDKRHSRGGGEKHDFRDGKDGGFERKNERRPSIVEKPRAIVIANQPNKVVRVLARGEKLDP
ncbi:hypothetical protein BU17DRAFT_98593 [Hysterangium stoloniferum]|nr:hypothetical protein BU17DRAFT_98593 [Hysterangium stoloniferum]